MKSHKLALLLAAVCSTACRGDSAETAPPETTETRESPHAHDELPSIVRVSDEVVRDARIATETARIGPLTPSLALAGELVTNPNKTARVAPPIAGRVVEVRFQEGDTVRKGDIVAMLRVTDATRVRSESVAAVARARTAESNAERLGILADKGLASAQDLAIAKAEAESATAAARASADQVRVLGADVSSDGSVIAVRSPLDGVVLARTSVPGQTVDASQAIVEVGDLSEMWFQARVFEKDLSRVRIGAQAEVLLNAFPEQRFAGKIEYIAQQIDPVARTLLARIRLPNPNGDLRVGLFGAAHIAIEGKTREALVVRSTAITEIGKQQVVFVRHGDDGDFEKHNVIAGETAMGLTEIIQGLKDGEVVVVDGVFNLKSIVLKSTIAEDE